MKCLGLTGLGGLRLLGCGILGTVIRRLMFVLGCRKDIVTMKTRRLRRTVLMCCAANEPLLCACLIAQMTGVLMLFVCRKQVRTERVIWLLLMARRVVDSVRLSIRLLKMHPALTLWSRLWNRPLLRCLSVTRLMSLVMAEASKGEVL